MYFPPAISERAILYSQYVQGDFVVTYLHIPVCIRHHSLHTPFANTTDAGQNTTFADGHQH